MFNSVEDDVNNDKWDFVDTGVKAHEFVTVDMRVVKERNFVIVIIVLVFKSLFEYYLTDEWKLIADSRYYSIIIIFSWYSTV